MSHEELKDTPEAMARVMAAALNDKYFGGEERVLAEDIVEQYTNFLETGEPAAGNRASHEFSEQGRVDVFKDIILEGGRLAYKELRKRPESDEVSAAKAESIGHTVGWNNLDLSSN